jgi:hypothetical protein
VAATRNNQVQNVSKFCSTPGFLPFAQNKDTQVLMIAFTPSTLSKKNFKGPGKLLEFSFLSQSVSEHYGSKQCSHILSTSTLQATESA